MKTIYTDQLNYSILILSLIFFSFSLLAEKTGENKENAKHFSYFKLVGEKLYLVIENRSKVPLNVSYYLKSMRLMECRGDAVNARVGNYAGKRVYSIAAKSQIKVDIHVFKPPSKDQKTVVNLDYLINGKSYEKSFKMAGHQYEIKVKLAEIKRNLKK